MWIDKPLEYENGILILTIALNYVNQVMSTKFSSHLQNFLSESSVRLFNKYLTFTFDRHEIELIFDKSFCYEPVTLLPPTPANVTDIIHPCGVYRQGVYLTLLHWECIICWRNRLQNLTCNFTYGNNISYVNCFNSICEMKILYVKLIFTGECSISYVKIFQFHVFHTWNDVKF